jgi:hypothetical protein
MKFAFVDGEKLCLYENGTTTVSESKYLLRARESALRSAKSKEWKRKTDMLVDDEHPEGVRVGIRAEYQSAFGDFGASERIKRSCRATVVASCDKGRLTLTLQSVSGRRVSLSLRGEGEEVSVLQGRVPMGRFRFLRVGVSSDDDAPLRLHSIRLSARCP